METPKPTFGSAPAADLVDLVYFLATVFDSLARTHNGDELIARCSVAAGVCRDIFTWDATPADIYIHRLRYNTRANAGFGARSYRTTPLQSTRVYRAWDDETPVIRKQGEK